MIRLIHKIVKNGGVLEKHRKINLLMFFIENIFRPTRVATGYPDFSIQLICAVHQNQIVAWDYTEIHERINQTRYIEFLDNRLRLYITYNEVRNPILLQDNAPAHNARATQRFIADQGWTLIDHPPYSPDMNPLDYDVNNKIKRKIKGKKFRRRADLIEAVDQAIAELNHNNTLIGTSNLPLVWQKIIDNNGQYVV